MTDIGLYIHVPFCATKCGYCDFYSHVPAPGAFEPLVDALLAELAQQVLARDVRVVTLFAGGGTPTLLPPASLRRLFAALRPVVQRHHPIEFTVEANPASLTDAKAAILREAGVTRISMGAQSFHPHELRALDRIHCPADIPRSAEIIHRAGFEHFNLDLIFGIPGQSRASLLESIRRAVDLGPDHLAGYGLTYEPDTPLRARRDAGLIRSANEDLEADFYELIMDRLGQLGFEQYEISNFARPGARCEHNLRYWRNKPVLGIGPSAAGYFQGRRRRNVPDTAEYVRRMRAGVDPSVECEELDPLQRAGETAMLALRLIEGISIQAFREQTGLDPLQLFAEPVHRHASAGLLLADDRHIALTRAGRLVADDIIADFLLPGPPGALPRPFPAGREAARS